MRTDSHSRSIAPASLGSANVAHVGLQRFQSGLAPLVKAGQVTQLQRETAELVARRQMRRDHLVVAERLVTAGEGIRALGQIDDFAGQQRIAERRRYRPLGADSVQAELERKQHAHEFGEHTFDFVQLQYVRWRRVGHRGNLVWNISKVAAQQAI